MPVTLPDVSLAEILLRCRRQDPVAQRALYERFAGPMLTVCRRYAPELADAEDVLQDAFVKVFERLDEQRNEGAFPGWFRRIVISTAIDAWHKRRVRRVDYLLEDAHHVPTPAASAVEQLTVEEVRGLIDQLPSGCRLVMLLYTVEGYSHAEIGHMLGISESSSKAQLTRARQRLTQLVRALERERRPHPAPPERPAPESFPPLSSLSFQ